MSLTLHVDGARWRAHLTEQKAAHPGLVPVLKGNGYGFGLPRLAEESTRLGVDTVAVGLYEEVAEVSAHFPGDVVVLNPWRPFGTAVETDPDSRLIHTVGRPGDLAALRERDPDARFIVELATSMLRHGFDARGLRAEAAAYGGFADQPLEGVTLHLPMVASGNLGEAMRLMNDVVAADLDTRRLWVSHLGGTELATFRARFGEYDVRPRIGTGLWLGDRGCLRVTATVLDAHPVARGDVFGYRGRSAPREGTVLVVSGGTAHGVGLESPTGDLSLKARAASLARGGLDAVGFVRSPYSVEGKLRLFAEPPHMQTSMLYLPAGAPVPEIGAEVDVRVRYTATDFDRVEIST